MSMIDDEYGKNTTTKMIRQRTRRSFTPTAGRRSVLAAILLPLLFSASPRYVVECASTSLNPFAIGIRSAVARAGFQGRAQTRGDTPSPRCLSALPATVEEDVGEYSSEERRPSLSTNSVGRGGGAAAAAAIPRADRRLLFWEAMVCGAISRSAAQTIMHPANTMKTILQSSRTSPGVAPLTIRSFAKWENFRLLTRGAGAQLVLSIPHGAVNFAVLEVVRRQMNSIVSQSRYADSINRNFGPGMDFLSSALSTVCCSVVSTPQMMICDNIMAGTYPNLVAATSGLMKNRGVAGFYAGWWPGIAGKIPSYGLTWTLFEQIKRVRTRVMKRPAKDIENSIMGCVASATTVCALIPLDTVKTRLVTQLNYPDLVAYKGISDCFNRILKEEGVNAFYRGLTPRLLSVVPMIGIQFGVYEFTKKIMLARNSNEPVTPSRRRASKEEVQRRKEEAEMEYNSKAWSLQEAAMEVAADDDQPFPAPYFKEKGWWGGLTKKNEKK